MKRVLTSALLIPVIVYVVLWADYWVFVAVLAAAACLCYREYDTIAARYGFGAPGPVGYGAGLVLLAWRSEAWLVITGLVLVAMVLALRAREVAKSLPWAALLVTGVVYAFGSWKCALSLRVASPHWLMYALLVNWASDIGAYYVGRRFGRHKLAPEVSPNKSWEGSLGGVVSSVLLAGAYLMRFGSRIPVPAIVALTVAANMAGQFGDLAESAMKRGAGVKDSGTLLPGHGGFLDRVDSTLFALPVIYGCMLLLG